MHIPPYKNNIWFSNHRVPKKCSKVWRQTFECYKHCFYHIVLNMIRSLVIIYRMTKCFVHVFQNVLTNTSPIHQNSVEIDSCYSLVYNYLWYAVTFHKEVLLNNPLRDFWPLTIFNCRYTRLSTSLHCLDRLMTNILCFCKQVCNASRKPSWIGCQM